jgi:hypothetical protein
MRVVQLPGWQSCAQGIQCPKEDSSRYQGIKFPQAPTSQLISREKKNFKKVLTKRLINLGASGSHL